LTVPPYTALLDRLRAEAALGDMPIDTPVYEQADRDPTLPILLGSGDLAAPIGVFGRDPGRHEVLLGEPFIGKGGQLVRDGLHRAARGGDCPDLAASIEVGRAVFWGNTVPYKPIGNKAWSTKIKRRFLPLVRELLVQQWAGADLLTLGNVAFDWFRLADPSLKPRMAEFWKREDRYETSFELELDGKQFRLHPLPHPSPLNARWYKLFPALLDARLAALSWHG
jgi:uracil-DNA glycosylase